VIKTSLNQQAKKAEALLREFASSKVSGADESGLALALASDIKLLLDDVESLHAAPPPVRPVPKALKQFITSALAQLVEIVCDNRPAGRRSKTPKTPPILASVAALIMNRLHYPEPLAVGAAAYVLMVITYSLRAGFCGVAREQLEAELRKMPTKGE
jgi:hypothetical protein